MQVFPIVVSEMTGFRLPPRSHRAQMTSVASSTCAERVIANLAAAIEADEGKRKDRKYKRGKRIEQFKKTLGAIVGELLYSSTLSDVEGWLAWPLEKQKYTQLSISQRDVANAIDGLVSLGLIDFERGKPHLSKNTFVENAALLKGAGYTSLLRLSEKGLTWFTERGLTGENYPDHFDDSIPLQCVVLRASSRRVNNEKQKGKTIPLPTTPKAKAVKADVEALNAFLSGFTLRPIPFRGLYRLFNEADHPDFDFNRGGRLYGAGNASYQTLGKEERKALTIDGARVAEIDVSSSFLTVVYGLLNLPFDTSADHYALKEFDRDLVKKWTVATLSSGQLTRWPVGVPAEYRKRTGKKIPPITEVQLAMERKHPALAQWAKTPSSWSVLMWHESEIILATLIALMKHDIPAYPVHDSIIVKQKDVPIAVETLRMAFQYKVGAIPALKVTP